MEIQEGLLSLCLVRYEFYSVKKEIDDVEVIRLDFRMQQKEI